jgi:hypothetical protein
LRGWQSVLVKGPPRVYSRPSLKAWFLRCGQLIRRATQFDIGGTLFSGHEVALTEGMPQVRLG